MKKINVITLGCSKNTVDSEHLMARLAAAGYEVLFDSDRTDAKVVVINTCGFIGDAKQESVDMILRAAAAKNAGKIERLFVIGCLSERYADSLRAELPEVDGFFGARTWDGIARALGAAEDPALATERHLSTPRHYAYLKISEGCNWKCGYCAIPLIRGPLRSRTIPDIVAEARFLAGEGVKELIVVAQDITAFGADRGRVEIAELLDALNAVEGIEWIRLLYAYPERITDAFIAAMTRNEKVLHYLDVPIQHINSEMLRAMNRRGDRETVLDALTRLRAAMPDITLRTTLITGYPGETQAQFEELCEFVKDYAFDRLGCFAYSEEEGTVAAGLPQLPQELREQRAEGVMNIQANVMARRQEEKVGRTVQVICDGYDDENDLYICRTRADAPDIDAECCVRSETPLEPGAFYRVTIEESDVYDLYGALAES